MGTAQILDTFAYYQTCFGNVGKDLYKIPNFKIALTESLKQTGFFVTDSKTVDSKSNCKKGAKKIIIPRPKQMKTIVSYDELHHLDKDIPLVPGTVPPHENQNIMQNNKKSNLK